MAFHFNFQLKEAWMILFEYIKGFRKKVLSVNPENIYMKMNIYFSWAQNIMIFDMNN